MDSPQFHGVDNATGIPFVVQDGHKRFLAALPRRRLMAPKAPSLSGLGFDLIPQSKWQHFGRSSLDAVTGIKDQNGYNSCVPNAGTGAAEKSWLLGGNAHVGFGPGWTYSKINGGRDQGANLDDCLTSMMKDGICPKSIVDESPFYPRQMPAAAAAAAARYRPDLVVSFEGFDAAGTVIQLGGVACYAICVGQNFGNLDSSGIAPTYPGSEPNHAQYADDTIVAGGLMCLDDVNSWADNFGLKGRCRLPETHFGTYPTGAYGLFHLGLDPDGPPMPLEMMVQHIASRAPTRGSTVNVPFGSVA